ncbi:MAG: hypothetical protein ACFE9S_09155 [Candidatus Hermodarchaeota archaeon]
MARILRDLWILTDSGLTLYSRVIDSKMGSQVFGGLMIALNTYAETLTEGGLSNFELSSMRFSILKKNHFIFVTKSSNKIKDKKVLNELKKISEKFFEVYDEKVLQNFSYNIRAFMDFEKYIIDSLEEAN